MNDAGEVLLTIYERVMEVSGQDDGPVQRIFGLPVAEHVQCHSCSRVTQQNSYTQFYQNITVRSGGLFGGLLLPVVVGAQRARAPCQPAGATLHLTPFQNSCVSFIPLFLPSAGRQPSVGARVVPAGRVHADVHAPGGAAAHEDLRPGGAQGLALSGIGCRKLL